MSRFSSLDSPRKSPPISGRYFDFLYLQNRAYSSLAFRWLPLSNTGRTPSRLSSPSLSLPSELRLGSFESKMSYIICRRLLVALLYCSCVIIPDPTIVGSRKNIGLRSAGRHLKMLVAFVFSGRDAAPSHLHKPSDIEQREQDPSRLHQLNSPRCLQHRACAIPECRRGQIFHHASSSQNCRSLEHVKYLKRKKMHEKE